MLLINVHGNFLTQDMYLLSNDSVLLQNIESWNHRSKSKDNEKHDKWP